MGLLSFTLPYHSSLQSPAVVAPLAVSLAVCSFLAAALPSSVMVAEVKSAPGPVSGNCRWSSVLQVVVWVSAVLPLAVVVALVVLLVAAVSDEELALPLGWEVDRSAAVVLPGQQA